MRCATVASVTRKARAISAVVKPSTARSVKAACASRARAGWQQMKSRRRRSSTSTCVCAAGGRDALSSRGTRSRYRASRRQRSTALRRAVVSSHAPGRRGMPSTGQCSSADTRASCTKSSARSKSPRRRTKAAVSCPTSLRKTSAIPRAAATATAPASSSPWRQACAAMASLTCAPRRGGSRPRGCAPARSWRWREPCRGRARPGWRSRRSFPWPL